MPRYPDGGDEGFRKYIAKNFRAPNSNKNIKGTMFVKFVVEIDGSITNIKVERDLGHGTAKEAIRIIKKSKKWIPGFQSGKAVRVNYKVPIALNIQSTGNSNNTSKRSDNYYNYDKGLKSNTRSGNYGKPNGN